MRKLRRCVDAAHRCSIIELPFLLPFTPLLQQWGSVRVPVTVLLPWQQPSCLSLSIKFYKMWFTLWILGSSAKSLALKTFFTQACARVYNVNLLADDEILLHFWRVHGGMNARDLSQAFASSFPVQVAQQCVPVLRGHWRTAQLHP